MKISQIKISESGNRPRGFFHVARQSVIWLQIFQLKVPVNIELNSIWKKL